MFPTWRDAMAMVESTGTGILIHDAATKNILWANTAACDMFGFTLDELRPLKAHHMSSQERQYRREVGVAWLHDAVVHGSSRRQWKYRTKDGHDFLTDASATLVRSQTGPVVMVEFRRAAEEELQHELDRVSDSLQRIMAYTAAGIVVLDNENRIEDISPLAARLFSRRAEDLMGVGLEELGECDPAPSARGVVDRLAAGTGSVTISMQIARAEGATWLAGELESVEHDGITTRVLTVRDVTDRVEWERLHAYQAANLQYLSRYNAMGDMAMILAHELGQPLAASTNFLRGIKARLGAGTVDPDSLAYGLDAVEKQLARAAEIVSSVKRYVRRIESTRAAIDLSDTVDESMYFVRLRAAERGVDVRVARAEVPLPIEGESVLIGQVLINLCFNAIDEIVLPTTAVKRLEVRTFADDDAACIAVLDRGRGMTAAPAGRLAADAFSTKEDGAGIGLILSEHIVERHNGELRYEPRAGGGTVATIRLPMRPD
ncbi:PAS domain S-box protein [Tsukamurella sp. 8F]|uniref:ATP-binding protein n=1 Tax=unclassified Tsukamurella TaxID=2633480 RepID=UPI0023B8B43D|nr:MULTISPECIES: ATP-binding protein [unclassified Tsukamurella]MDF0529267.1 PAS domain S-box protein [Tsukamurella sp. 8J]MDF0586896.1 PAS domain S-box protein [Tsukamurella sp. 8F]